MDAPEVVAHDRPGTCDRDETETTPGEMIPVCRFILALPLPVMAANATPIIVDPEANIQKLCIPFANSVRTLTTAIYDDLASRFVPNCSNPHKIRQNRRERTIDTDGMFIHNRDRRMVKAGLSADGRSTGWLTSPALRPGFPTPAQR